MTPERPDISLDLIGLSCPLPVLKARKALVDLRIRLQSQNEHAVPGAVQKAHARVLKGLDIETAKIEDAITAIKGLTQSQIHRARAQIRANRGRALRGRLTPETADGDVA